MGHQLKGGMSQGRILKSLPVDENDIMEKVKSMRKMRESVIIEVIMKRNWVHCTSWPHIKAMEILPAEQVGS